MKQATILLSLTKNHQVPLTGVTPFEAMLLVAEHQRGAGGNPVEVDKATIVDVKPDRTEDQEIARLRGKYNAKKLEILTMRVRTWPKDFDEAVKKGLELTLPTEALAQAKLT